MHSKLWYTLLYGMLTTKLVWLTVSAVYCLLQCMYYVVWCSITM